MKEVENSHENTRNCTIFFIICPPNPLATARSFANLAMYTKTPRNFKISTPPPPLRNPAYAPAITNNVYV